MPRTTKLERDLVATLLEVVVADERRTAMLKVFAKGAVILRGRHEWEGRPDWAGASPDYKKAMGKIYREAGVEPDSVSGLQASIRYHIGNRLRDVVSEEELVACSLDPLSPLGRVKRNRNQTEDWWDLAGMVEGDGNDPVTRAAWMVDRLRDLAAEGLRGEMADAVRPQLQELVTVAQELLTQLGPAPRRKRLTAVS